MGTGTAKGEQSTQAGMLRDLARCLRIDTVNLRLRPQSGAKIYFPDDQYIWFGDGLDAKIGHDGTNLFINPAEVGSGVLKLGAALHLNHASNSVVSSAEVIRRSATTNAIALDARGDVFINIDSDDNETTKKFAVRADGGSTDIFAVFESGLALTTASATGSAGFRLPHGSAPSSPVNGDIWTTTSGLFARINGTTVQFATV